MGGAYETESGGVPMKQKFNVTGMTSAWPVCSPRKRRFAGAPLILSAGAK